LSIKQYFIYISQALNEHEETVKKDILKAARISNDVSKDNEVD